MLKPTCKNQFQWIVDLNIKTRKATLTKKHRREAYTIGLGIGFSYLAAKSLIRRIKIYQQDYKEIKCLITGNTQVKKQLRE